LRADFPRAWALAEESAPLVAALATRRRDADALVPLLETLVRAARGKQATRSDRVDEDDDGRSAVRASAGARALSAALSAVPSTTSRDGARVALARRRRARVRDGRARRARADAADVRGGARAGARLEIERRPPR
jgi:hypothetical protein